MRIPRKIKKKLRIIFLCHSGNPKVRKEKISKENWVYSKKIYREWLRSFDSTDVEAAKTIK